METDKIQLQNAPTESEVNSAKNTLEALKLFNASVIALDDLRDALIEDGKYKGTIKVLIKENPYIENVYYKISGNIDNMFKLNNLNYTFTDYVTDFYVRLEQDIYFSSKIEKYFNICYGIIELYREYNNKEGVTKRHPIYNIITKMDKLSKILKIEYNPIVKTIILDKAKENNKNF